MLIAVLFVFAVAVVSALSPVAAGSTSLLPDSERTQSYTAPSDLPTPAFERAGGYSVGILPRVSWPVPPEISSAYGRRTCSEDQPCSANHAGVDLAPGSGFVVRAVAAGTVVGVHRADDDLLGVNITIAHGLDGERVSTVYGHLAAGSTLVAAGDKVGRGDALATIGDTGRSYGVHLHFEVRTVGGATIDPMSWMRAHNALAYPG